MGIVPHTRGDIYNILSIILCSICNNNHKIECTLWHDPITCNNYVVKIIMVKNSTECHFWNNAHSLSLSMYRWYDDKHVYILHFIIRREILAIYAMAVHIRHHHRCRWQLIGNLKNCCEQCTAVAHDNNNNNTNNNNNSKSNNNDNDTTNEKRRWNKLCKFSMMMMMLNGAEITMG